MKKRSYAVIGLGKFGYTVALTLAEANCDVMVVDKDPEIVQEMSDRVAYAVCADVTENGVMESLGVGNTDVAVIGIAESMEASITAVIHAKDAGVPYVLAKAMNPLHGRILTRIGADEVIYPEKAMGMRVAKYLISGGFVDLFEISDSFSIVETKVPEEWIGKTLIELNLRERLNLNVIGIKKEEKVTVNIDPSEMLQRNEILIVIGENEDLSRICE